MQLLRMILRRPRGTLPVAHREEPITGLDGTIESDIMELIVELCRGQGLTGCLITHDLRMVAETGTMAQIVADAIHPYARYAYLKPKAT